MCDKGILESHPDFAKLEYCMIITPEIIKKTEDGLSKLLGQKVFWVSPKPGEYPQDKPQGRRNEILLCTTPEESWWNKMVAHFSLQELPGCCGILVSYHTTVNNQFRGKGVNTFLQEIKADIARLNGYTVLMATTRDDNPAEIAILEKTGWFCPQDFVNKRTENKVRIYFKNL